MSRRCRSGIVGWDRVTNIDRAGLRNLHGPRRRCRTAPGERSVPRLPGWFGDFAPQDGLPRPCRIDLPSSSECLSWTVWLLGDAVTVADDAASHAGAEVGAAQCGLVGEFKGCHLGAGDGGQEVVGQGRVAGQDRAVQVGADDTVGADALGGAAGVVAGAVAGAGDHGAQRGGAGAEGGDAVVVFEPGELPDVGDRAGGGDFADGAAPAGCGGDVQDAEPGVVLAGAVPHGVAEYLQAGAHRKDPGAGVQGVLEVPVVAEPVRGEQLRGVLAAAEQVHIAPGGWGGVRGDGEDLGGDCLLYTSP